ncbi:MAG: polysaccharide biosynthesis tyrosine autokinase [Anaerolineae bacterium]|uniref:polysaccharide biosynthesis tyrosine autokinase n=1 Tax=Candidatus Flexifilum breve TaxID=3140694 RepID=UPI001ACDDC7A|nr:polysaccharide biosynthesis tyrosine autokinase [Chloroflexota bacterium]MBK9748209.1 polysaccharide biosynthesis tyrosine autokinase [Chloroflexota bacterium]MBN8635654.1 polysaccharide biosynthesis tyrosine autokinase [Anaerolineae bacterium]
MELAPYIQIFRRWLLLIALVALVVGSVNFINGVNRPPSYEAQVTISIGPSLLDQANPSSADIYLGMDLAPTYQQLIISYEILQSTVEALDLPMAPEDLGGYISSAILPNTALLVVSAQYDDPVLAADIVNTLAEQLILKSPTNLTPEQEEQVAFANEQIAELNILLQRSREQLNRLDEEILASNEPARVTELTQQRNDTVEQINLALATVAEFSATISTIQQRTNAIDIVERARVPQQSINVGPIGSAIGAGILGAILAYGVALVFEYFNDTLRSSEEVTRTLQLPVFGAITTYGNRKKRDSELLITNHETFSTIAESYRSLRTNVLYALGENPKIAPVIVVTSPGPEEGKTLTASNLAVAMAQANLRVLLIDADLRRPKVHTMFGLPNNVGLSTLLRADFNHGTPEEQNRRLRECFQTSGIPKLRIITSGIIPPNPAELIGSPLTKSWIDAFRAAQDVDLIIFDSPPCLTITDSTILVGGVDANVLLVVSCGRTQRRAAIRAKEVFTQVNKEILGVIANRVNPQEEAYSYGYHQYYTYSYGGENPSRLGRLLQSLRLRRGAAEKK